MIGILGESSPTCSSFDSADIEIQSFRYRAKFDARKVEIDSFIYVPPNHIASPSLKAHHYIGEYFDEGYGSISICPTILPPSATLHLLPSICSKLLHKLSSTSQASNITLPTSSTGPALLVSMPGFFGASHILLHHHNGNIFKGTFAIIFDPIGDTEQSLLAYDEQEIDEVEVRFGVDFKGSKPEKVWKVEIKGIWGEGEEVKKRNGVANKNGNTGDSIEGYEVRFLKDSERKLDWE